MIDDHDECEWVNVSSGTGSPGLSGQNPQSHKTHTHTQSFYCSSGICPELPG